MLGSEESVGLKDDVSITNNNVSIFYTRKYKKFPTVNYSSLASLASRNPLTQKSNMKSRVKSLENFLNNSIIRTSVETKSPKIIKGKEEKAQKIEKRLYNLKIKNFTNINKFITLEKNKSDDRNSDNNYNEQTLTSSNRKPENKNKLLETIELTFTKKPVSYTYNFKEKQKKYQNSTLKGTN
jgi:hypothetical protein